MNWNENDSVNGDDVAIAAYLFGELDATERATFEARLETDDALRSRLEEFAATRDAVRGAFAADARLPAESHASLALVAARSRKRRPNVLRVAAAAAVLLAATYVLQGNRPPVEKPKTIIYGYTVGDEAALREFGVKIPAGGFTPLATASRNASLTELRASKLAFLPAITNPDPNRAGLDSYALVVSGRQGSSAAHLPTDPARSNVEFDLNAFKSPQIGKILPPGREITEEEGSPFDSELKQLGYLGEGASSTAGVQFFMRGFFDPVTPAESAAILQSCERLPNERPAEMYFRFWGDNAFERAQNAPLSTFSIDVDTASYALAREYLERGVVPEKAQIRTEEFINWWKPDVTLPQGVPLWISSELGPSPFGGDPNRRMLRVVVRGREFSPAERPRMNLELVVDTSGSMATEGRLELVKNAIRLLVAKLEPNDSLGIVRFSDQASIVVPLAHLSDRAGIEAVIASLAPQQSTNAEAGLRLGFNQISASFDVEANNHVVLFSDGVANVGNIEASAILNTVAEQRGKGVYLSTIGVGFSNHNDTLLEQLADKGDGSCAYVDSEKEAMRAIVDRFSGAFQPVARNVKIQVEFDPRQVSRYRLLGYENRALAAADFRNDAVDAGELGAGAQVCALYEIEPAAGFGDNGATPLATSRVRWLPPHGHGDSAGETGCAVFGNQEAKAFDSASLGFRRTVLVAQFAEFLRRSTHALSDSFDELVRMSEALASPLADPDFDQLVLLLKKSRDLIVATLPKSDPLREAIDAVRRNRILKAEIEDAAAAKKAGSAEQADVLKQLEEENRRLEELLKRLLGK